MSSFVAMAGITSVIVALVVIITVIVRELYQRMLRRGQKQTLQYLGEKTSELYFYGYPLSHCLDAGLARGLDQYGVGDFTRQLGMLTLCALSGTDRDPAIYYRFKNNSSDDSRGRYTVIVRFFYGNRWWQFNLPQQLGEKNLRPVPRHSDHETDGYERMTFWDLPHSKRHILEGCKNPGKSNLMPDVKYDGTESKAAFTKNVRRAVDSIMNIDYRKQE